MEICVDDFRLREFRKPIPVETKDIDRVALTDAFENHQPSIFERIGNVIREPARPHELLVRVERQDGFLPIEDDALGILRCAFKYLPQMRLEALPRIFARRQHLPVQALDDDVREATQIAFDQLTPSEQFQ